MPTWSLGSDDSTPEVEFNSERRFVYGYKPIPMPCINTIGSFVLEVWGRCQYVVCLAGERYLESKVYGLSGKSLKRLETEVR